MLTNECACLCSDGGGRVSKADRKFQQIIYKAAAVKIRHPNVREIPLCCYSSSSSSSQLMTDRRP